MEMSVINFILALSIGAIIGLEREIMHQKDKVTDFAGIRTFILISILGFLISHITLNIFNSFSAYIVSFAIFFIFVASSYVILGIKTKRYGATSEIAAILVFLLSSVITLNQTQEFRLFAIIIAVIVASLLAVKEHLHKFAKKIQMNEVFAAIKFALISIIILPFLPNKNYSILEIEVIEKLLSSFPSFSSFIGQLDVFNLFKIWLMVVFISGLSFVAYILVRLIGSEKGIGLTSFLGGMVSSTAVTVSLSEKSKGKKFITPFVFGIVLASSIMFIRVLIEVAVINNSLVSKLILPLIAMAFVGLISAFIVSKIKKQDVKEKVSFKSPFALGHALKFGLFFVFILVLSKTLFLLFGDKGIYIAALVAGLADVDAIVLTLSSLALTGLEPRVAVLGIILAVCSNTLVKIGIAYFSGDKKMAKRVLIILVLSLIVGISVALLV